MYRLLESERVGSQVTPLRERVHTLEVEQEALRREAEELRTQVDAGSVVEKMVNCQKKLNFLMK